MNSRKLAAVIGAGLLAMLVVAMVPGAQAAGGYSTCAATKKIVLKLDNGDGTTRPYPIQVKSVAAKALPCADAYKLIGEVMSGVPGSKEGSYAQDYKCKAGSFPLPSGFYAQVCTKGSKGVKWGQPGG